MLTKNSVKVVDKNRDVLLDDLSYMVRPITNKKFLDVFPIRTSLYVNNLPKTDSAGNVIKDTKFMQKMRNVGEEPVLLDTSMISYSLDQIYTATKNWGYFEAKAWDTIIYKDPNKLHPRRHKAEVIYYVEAGEPYYIRDIRYFVDIFEYKRIIQKDTVNRLINPGDKYNAETLLEERDRIVGNIRDNGYYYVSNDIISFSIDTIHAADYRDKKGHKTLVVNILVNFNRIKDPAIKENHAYKFYFNDVTIYPNFNTQADSSQLLTTKYHRSKSDNTNYYIVSTRRDSIPKKCQGQASTRHPSENLGGQHPHQEGRALFGIVGHPFAQEAQRLTQLQLP